MSGHFGATNSATNSDDEEPFVYTSIRYDVRLLDSPKNTAASCNRPCPFYLFEHHWTRLQIAKWSTFFFTDDRPRPNSGGPAVLLQVLLKAIRHWHDNHPGENPDALRVKFKCYVGGRMATEIHHPLYHVPMDLLFPTTFTLPPDEPPITWTVVLDTQPTEPGEGTMFKTSDRSTYARARATADIMTYMVFKEVILYTPDNHILDASICTLYLYRRGRWVTPASAVGGLQGTTRRWALENKLAYEDMVPIDSLVDGEIVWLSNAVRGYFRARYCAREPPKSEPDEDTVQRIHRERFM